MKKFILFSFIFGVFACKSIPKEQEITVGSGGGFANLWQSYTIKPSGEILYRTNKSDSVKVIQKLTKSQTKKIFKAVQGLHLDSLSQNETGNMNHYLIFSEGKKFAYKTQWTNPKNVNDSIKTFYQSLMDKIKN